MPVDLVDESEITFPLDTHRAVAMRNQLDVHVTVDGKNIKGEPANRNDEAHTDFIARPKDPKWRDYAIIMWQSYPSNLLPALRKIGIDAGEFSGRSKSLPEGLIDNDMRWYAENIGTDFYSEYHRWRPDRRVDWSFLQVKQAFEKDPTNKENFKRHPSFWDPVWRSAIHDRLVDSAKRNSPYRPCFTAWGTNRALRTWLRSGISTSQTSHLYRCGSWLQTAIPEPRRLEHRSGERISRIGIVCCR